MSMVHFRHFRLENVSIIVLERSLDRTPEAWRSVSELERVTSFYSQQITRCQAWPFSESSESLEWQFAAHGWDGPSIYSKNKHKTFRREIWPQPCLHP